MSIYPSVNKSHLHPTLLLLGMLYCFYLLLRCIMKLLHSSVTAAAARADKPLSARTQSFRSSEITIDRNYFFTYNGLRCHTSAELYQKSHKPMKQKGGKMDVLLFKTKLGQKMSYSSEIWMAGSFIVYNQELWRTGGKLPIPPIF